MYHYLFDLCSLSAFLLLFVSLHISFYIKSQGAICFRDNQTKNTVPVVIFNKKYELLRHHLVGLHDLE